MLMPHQVLKKNQKKLVNDILKELDKESETSCVKTSENTREVK